MGQKRFLKYQSIIKHIYIAPCVACKSEAREGGVVTVISVKQFHVRAKVLRSFELTGSTVK